MSWCPDFEFRGIQKYNEQCDIFSFGILLVELTFRHMISDLTFFDDTANDAGDSFFDGDGELTNVSRTGKSQ